MVDKNQDCSSSSNVATISNFEIRSPSCAKLVLSKLGIRHPTLLEMSKTSGEDGGSLLLADLQTIPARLSLSMLADENSQLEWKYDLAANEKLVPGTTGKGAMSRALMVS